MKVAITGATGFLGRPLLNHLQALGHHCVVLSRDPQRAAQAGLPTGVPIAPLGSLPAVEAIIHLAGESVIGLWTPAKRRRILESRVSTTRALVKAIQGAAQPPRVLLSASAIGIYGHRPGERLDESAQPDPRKRFRSRVCQAWEAEALAAQSPRCRVVPLRIGNVMAPQGGFLAGLLPVYRTCGAFVLGDGSAAFSWISLEDAVSLLAFALENESLVGPLNVVAPNPISQATLAKTLGPRVGRTVRGRLPGGLLRTVMGEFSSTILDDQKVVPAKALAAGFRFAQPAWRSCLDAIF